MGTAEGGVQRLGFAWCVDMALKKARARPGGQVASHLEKGRFVGTLEYRHLRVGTTGFRMGVGWQGVRGGPDLVECSSSLLTTVWPWASVAPVTWTLGAARVLVQPCGSQWALCI